MLMSSMALPLGPVGRPLCGLWGQWSEGLITGARCLQEHSSSVPLAPFNRVRRMVIDYFRMKFGRGRVHRHTLGGQRAMALGRVLRAPEDRVPRPGERRFLEPVRAGCCHGYRKRWRPLIDTFRKDRKMAIVMGRAGSGSGTST